MFLSFCHSCNIFIFLTFMLRHLSSPRSRPVLPLFILLSEYTLDVFWLFKWSPQECRLLSLFYGSLAMWFCLESLKLLKMWYWKIYFAVCTLLVSLELIKSALAIPASCLYCLSIVRHFNFFLISTKCLYSVIGCRVCVSKP